MTDEKEVQPTGKLPPIKSKSAKPVYEVIAGFNFGCKTPDDEGTRIEPGPLTVKLPPDVLADLIEAGAIVEVADDGR